MSQVKNNRTVGMVLGMLILAASLWADWLFIPHAKFTIGESHSLPFDMPVTLTGLNGSAGAFGVRLPIWLIIALGLFSLSIMLLNYWEVTSLPRPAFIIPCALCIIYVGMIFAAGTLNDGAGIYRGPALAATGLAVGIFAGRSTLSRSRTKRRSPRHQAAVAHLER